MGYVDHGSEAAADMSESFAGVRAVRAPFGDLRQPGRLILRPSVRSFLDLEAPVAAVLMAVAHHLTAADGPAR